jgi:hypothetical protein
VEGPVGFWRALHLSCAESDQVKTGKVNGPPDDAPLNAYAQELFQQPVFRNAEGFVDLLGKTEFQSIGFFFPITSFVADHVASAGGAQASASQAGVYRKKPGNLGLPKGSDGVRAENKVKKTS